MSDGILKLPVVVQAPDRPETRRIVGAWSDTISPPYETIEMAGWAKMDDVLEVKKRRHEGQPCWLIITTEGFTEPDYKLRMQAFIDHAVSRRCMWLAPWEPGETLKVWLPSGEIVIYDDGKQADIDDLDARLKRRGF